MTEHPTGLPPLSVLFVCTANICRSPYMELLARHLAASGGTDSELRFASAGTMAMREEPMDPTMAAELSQRGVSADGFRSRRATGALLEQADLVLTAESSHRALLLEEHPGDARHDIVDPYGRGSEAAAASAERIDQLVSTVVRRLREVDVRQ